jgi:hypothetical protein
MTFLKMLSQHLSGGTEKNYKISQENESLFRDSNLAPPEYIAIVLTTAL